MIAKYSFWFCSSFLMKIFLSWINIQIGAFIFMSNYSLISCYIYFPRDDYFNKKKLSKGTLKNVVLTTTNSLAKCVRIVQMQKLKIRVVKIFYQIEDHSTLCKKWGHIQPLHYSWDTFCYCWTSYAGEAFI